MSSKTSQLEQAFERYERTRAIDKFEGRVEKPFPTKDFQKAIEALKKILAKGQFNSEDIGDMVRIAVS